MTLTAEQRAFIKAEISRVKNTLRCVGCGVVIERTTDRRRYCTRACANRHWHVRRKTHTV